MKNKTHTITLRLNDLEYHYLNRLVVKRINMDGFEGYTQSDILRLALSYMVDIEIWGSKTTTYDPEIGKLQQEYAKSYWKEKKDE